MIDTKKYDFYELKYTDYNLSVPPYFKKQFCYLIKKYMPKMLLSPSNYTVLDLGGGTGEYAMQIKELGFKVTVFDFSSEACNKAVSKGLKVINGDFHTYKFDCQYDIVFIKGFSLLNTDNISDFKNIWGKIGTITKEGGINIFWGATDLSGQWTDSGWYYFTLKQIKNILPKCQHLILPAFRYQLIIPHFL